MCIEYRAKCGDVRALARNKSEFLKSLYKEGPNVLLAVNNANARPTLRRPNETTLVGCSRP